MLVLACLIVCASFLGFRKLLAGRKPNIILVVVDALRPDRLSCYGYRKHSTPNIDRLAASGTIWQTAFSPMPMTQPAFTTIYTSLQPFSHGIIFNDSVALAPGAVTLPEILREQGWETAAVAGASNLDSVFGLNQGYEFYQQDMNAPGGSRAIGNIARWERKAEEVNAAVFQWLTARDPSRSFFLMIHYFDTHAPYRPPAPFLPQSTSLSDLYDGEVRYVDDQIGELLQRLQDSNLLSDTLIILTADHGEAFGEHGVIGHKWMVYDEFLRVPLIFSGPGIPAGLRRESLVQHADLAPTILNYLGLKTPAFYQGKSMLPLLQNPAELHDFILLQKGTPPDKAFQSRPGWQKFPQSQWAVRTKNEKLIWSSRDEFEYYDLRSDAGEKQNLYFRRTDRARQLYQMGRQYISTTPHINLVFHPGRDRLDPGAEEALRALGYLN